MRKNAVVEKVVTLIDSQTFGTDYMTWDTVLERPGWENPMNPTSASDQQVSELLAEQVEAADLVLLNKVDMATNEQVEIAYRVASALNQKADFRRVEFGRLSPSELLAGKGASTLVGGETESSHLCHSHEHSHGHSQPSEGESENDHSHNHSHDHNHDASTCTDPDCTDTSHSHSHHSHSSTSDTHGIGNFVYKSCRPFSTQRVLDLLNRWPIPRKEVLDLEYIEKPQLGLPHVDENPFVGVLRAKGFCWFAPNEWEGPMNDSWRHDTAMFMSQAGRHMSITAAGKWWATIPKESMSKYFDEGNRSELDRILKDDFVSDEFGDRRQELVFIGVDVNEKAIREALDSCLLTDEEMEKYRQQLDSLEHGTYAVKPSPYL